MLFTLNNVQKTFGKCQENIWKTFGKCPGTQTKKTKPAMICTVSILFVHMFCVFPLNAAVFDEFLDGFLIVFLVICLFYTTL